MRASRAYLAGLGTAGSLVIGTILLFTLGSAVVAFHGWRPLGIGSPATQTLQPREAHASEHRAHVAAATAAVIHSPGAVRSALTGVAALPVSTPDGLIATLPGRVRVGGGRGHKVGVSGSHRHAATRRGHAPVTTAPTSTPTPTSTITPTSTTTTTATPTSPTAAAPTPTPSTTAPVATKPSRRAPVSHPAPPVRVTVPVVSRPVNPPRHGVPSILNKIGSVVSKRHPVTRPTVSRPTPPPVQHPIPHPGPPPGPHPGPPIPTAGHGPHGPGPHGPGPHGHGPSPVAGGPPPGLIGRPSPPPIGVPSPGQGLHHLGPPPGIGAGGNRSPGHGFGRSRG